MCIKLRIFSTYSLQYFLPSLPIEEKGKVGVLISVLSISPGHFEADFDESESVIEDLTKNVNLSYQKAKS